MIKRDYYLDQLIKYMWNGDIKVITGIRRSGKSTLLFDIFKDYLLSQDVKDENILVYSLDQRRYYEYRNPIILAEEVEKRVTSSKEKIYLFIDEIQFSIKVKNEITNQIEVTVFDMLNELKSYKNLDVYVTGSNSKMLSSDIVTEFRGRSSQIHIYPLSFKEIVEYTDKNPQDVLRDYMLFGGLPRVIDLEEKEKKKYLSNIFDEVYLKDILDRNRIDKKYVFDDILNYLSSQISSLTNPNNIANALSTHSKSKVNPELVSTYIDYAMDSFLLYCAKRYDVKGKSYFKFPNKYYFTDLGLRNARLNYRQYDPGHIMENIIYNHLIQNGYQVDVGVVVDRSGGKNIQREIDFVVNDIDKRVYIQSALNIENDDKMISELSSLRLTNDFFKKIIVRNDITHNFVDESGITHCSLIDFLLNKIPIF